MKAHAILWKDEDRVELQCFRIFPNTLWHLKL